MSFGTIIGIIVAALIVILGILLIIAYNNFVKMKKIRLRKLFPLWMFILKRDGIWFLIW